MLLPVQVHFRLLGVEKAAFLTNSLRANMKGSVQGAGQRCYCSLTLTSKGNKLLSLSPAVVAKAINHHLPALAEFLAALCQNDVEAALQARTEQGW